MEHPSGIASGKTSRIVVGSHRKWFGDQKWGTFTLYLDHARAGTLPPTGRVELPCLPGSHLLRARQWWYLSPPVEVDVPEGESVFLIADVAHRGQVLRAMRTLALTPWRALSLAIDPQSRK